MLLVAMIWLTVGQLPAWAQDDVITWLNTESSDNGTTATSAVWTDYVHPGDSTPPAGLPIGGTVQYGCKYHDPNYRKHTGVDFPAAIGTTVQSTMYGKVVFAGWGGDWGNLVVVENNGVQIYLAHMSSVSVSGGQTIERGAKVGEVGSTGNSTGPHLHYGIKIKTEAGGAVWVNPFEYFGSANYVDVGCDD